MSEDGALSTYEKGVLIRKLIGDTGVSEARQVEQMILHFRRHPVEGIDERDIRWYGKDILSGNWPNPPSYPEQELRERFSKLARKAAVAKVGKKRAVDPLASKLYGSPALPPDMAWPTTDDGRQMIFLGQFNLSRIGVPLDTLKDAAMLSVFVADVDHMDIWEDEPKVFAFPSTEGLVAREVPEGIDLFKERVVTFKIVDDYPELDDPALLLPFGLDWKESWKTNIPDVLDDFPHNTGTKIGGYPNTIQTNYALWYAREVIKETGTNPFILQISTDDADMDVGDFGVLYVGRFPEDRVPEERLGNPWIVEFQMY